MIARGMQILTSEHRGYFGHEALDSFDWDASRFILHFLNNGFHLLVDQMVGSLLRSIPHICRRTSPSAGGTGDGAGLWLSPRAGLIRTHCYHSRKPTSCFFICVSRAEETCTKKCHTWDGRSSLIRTRTC